MGKVMRRHMRVIVVLLSAAATVGLTSCREQNQPQPPAVSSTSNPNTNPKGYALAIGLNQVDPAHYAGWNGQLYGCEPDAKDMGAIAVSQGLTTEILLTAQATRKNVLEKLNNLAQTLTSGDLLVVSYSGHGGQVPDLNGDETDALDETWCLYDGELIDDELHGAWMQFKPGVHILVFSDSCHSGTVIKMVRSDMENPPASRTKELADKWEAMRVPAELNRARLRSLPEMRDAAGRSPLLRERIGRLAPATTAPNVGTRPLPSETAAEEVFVARSMPPKVLVETYKQNQQFYDEKGKAAPKEDPKTVKASLILISGCGDSQTSADIGFNGLFTAKVKNVWNNGTFTGDHRKFHKDISDLVKQESPRQVPNFFLAGADDEPFIQQRPYVVQ